MEYNKSTSFTMINTDKTKVQLINDNLYDITYELTPNGLQSHIKGRIINIDDGEGEFSTHDKPSITLDYSIEFHAQKIDILLERITYIEKYKY